ncbi:hypothetical protein MLD38_006465 [Melastoma candidum]|uniref:Uncharacterized protein n=1 Tax=Melastoma candidum TaxID=119954 RepID=A0ACB9RP63_9MYRT|nr:hypothetical protein MLD38_006465 [Melastoma candidum]
MRHLKKDCYRYKNWLEKQKKKNVGGKPSALVCFESNLADVSSNTWWIDSGASVHIVMTLQGFQRQRMPNEYDGKVKVGNNAKAAVEFIGVVRLPLDLGFELVLENVLYIPTFRRNLISVHVLDKVGFSCLFQNGIMQLSLNSKVVGSATLSNGLYRLDLVPSYGVESLCAESSAPKRVLSNEKSSMLWHKRLGHIYKERVEPL